jgi:UDP-N-acetylmuramate--alanine ligase
MAGKQDEMKEAQNIYFLGIGGIGMSAIARYFHLKGDKVSGYDRVRSRVTEALELEGIEVFYTQDVVHLTGKDRVVYTPAIKEDNIELAAAMQMDLDLVKRAEVLGEISRRFRTIAVAGTHGKTTTSTMMTHVFRSCGLDVTAFLGGISRNLGSNFILGSSDLMIAEADEYDRSFLKLWPEMALITSVDPDHLDIYGDPDAMWNGFRSFAGQLKAEGTLLVHEKIANRDWGRPVRTYGINAGEFRAENLRADGLATRFDLCFDSERISNIRLSMPGAHNVLNVVAAMSSAHMMGVPSHCLKPAVESFSGIYRRFEVHLHSHEISYVDDYAHHPAEISAAIDTARFLFPERQLVVIFQPHLFSRTRDFRDAFAASLSQADAVLMMDIYPAREKPIKGVSSAWVMEAISGIPKALVSREGLADGLDKMIKRPSVVLSLGAGDIDKEVEKVRDFLNEKRLAEA